MSKQTNLKEIEIKLFANNEVLTAVRKSQLFTQHSKQQWQSKELLNQYLDTPQLALTEAKVALRVRQDGNQYIQTLKTRGHSTGGLSERDEYDWFINSPQVELSLLDERHWPQILGALDKTTLGAIFSTDFIRDYILMDWQYGDEFAQFEVAVDKGVIKTAKRQQPLNELELELRHGSLDVMMDFAITLAKTFPLIPSDLSKAERGYRLLNPERYQFQSFLTPVDQDLLSQSRYYLGVSQRLVECYLWQPDLAVLVSWVSQLQALANNLEQIAPADLHNLLTPILQDWQQYILISDEQQLAEKVTCELNNTRWGVFALSVARWLLSGV